MSDEDEEVDVTTVSDDEEIDATTVVNSPKAATLNAETDENSPERKRQRAQLDAHGDANSNQWLLGTDVLMRVQSTLSKIVCITKAQFDELVTEIKVAISQLLNVPQTHAIIFLQSTKEANYTAVVFNLCKSEIDYADYVVSGSQSKEAFEEGRRHCKAAEILRCDSTVRIMGIEQLQRPTSKFVHLTSDEGSSGIQFRQFPSLKPHTSLVADMSSDFCSRPLEIGKFGLIYADLDKTLGVGGLTIVIVRKDLIGDARPTTPSTMDYKCCLNYLPRSSRYCLSMLLPVVQNLSRSGGLKAVQLSNRKKADMVYEFIDHSSGYYTCPVDQLVRSMISVKFLLPTLSLEDKFLQQAAMVQNMIQPQKQPLGNRFLLEAENLAEHSRKPLAMGVLVSISNAMPLEFIVRLVDFMKDFQVNNADTGHK